MVQEDYVMRVIREIVRLIARLVFNKDITDDNLVDPIKNPLGYDIYSKLIAMADQGNINEAENSLSEIIDPEDKNTLEIALGFYLHINHYEDKFLDAADYSREEIRDGVLSLSKTFGVSLDPNLFL